MNEDERPRLPENDPKKDEYGIWDNAFHITINTNSVDRVGLKEALRALWKFITENTILFIYGREGARLLRVEENAEIEVGDVMKRVHLHGIWVYRTEGIANIDLDKLRTFVNDNLRMLVPGFVRANIWYRVVKGYNSVRIVMDYINKGARSANVFVEKE